MRFPYLDGLRGLAALIVVIDHFAISFFPAATDGSVRITHGAFESVIQKTPLHILVSGNFSVCVFFILSGIVLSTKFFRTDADQVILASAAKRYIRLALPVLACVLLGFGLMTLNLFSNGSAAELTGSTWLGSFWQFQPNFLSALYHGTAGIFIDGSSRYNTVLWTMKTELIGSFIVFGTLLLFGKWRYRALAYLVLGLLFIKTYYITFVMGIVLCDIYHHTARASLSRLRSSMVWTPLLLASIFLASSPVGTLNGTLFHYAEGLLPAGMSVTTTTHILGALGLIIAILLATPLQNLLATKPLIYLGKLSFGLYLTHFYVIGSFSSYLFAKLAPAIGYRAGFLVMLIPSVAIIWLTAHFFMRLVDQPAIRLSGKFSRLLRGTVPLAMRHVPGFSAAFNAASSANVVRQPR